MTTIQVAARRYHLGEEVACSVTHGIGTALAIVGAVVLITAASLRGDVWHIVGCSVFGGSLILLYAVSTVYHTIRRPGAKAVLRKLDHSAIYILIAGTYTPFTLVNLHGPWGWSLFGVVWGIALFGVISKTSRQHKCEVRSLALYLVMGWAVLAVIKPLLSTVASGGILLLVAGGLAYTVGSGFYAWDRQPYGHVIWHAFVLAGSIFHYFAVLLYVIPASTLPGG
jgi:hemolysin III